MEITKEVANRLYVKATTLQEIIDACDTSSALKKRLSDIRAAAGAVARAEAHPLIRAAVPSVRDSLIWARMMMYYDKCIRDKQRKTPSFFLRDEPNALRSPNPYDALKRDLVLLAQGSLAIVEAVECKTEVANGTFQAHDVTNFQASKDYRTIKKNGKTHQLTRTQAAVVKYLHTAHHAGTPSVHISELQERASFQSVRLKADLFKGAEDTFEALIEPVHGRKGFFRLKTQ